MIFIGILIGTFIGIVLMGLMAASSQRSRCEECRFLSRQGEWTEIMNDRHRMLKVLKCSNCGEKNHFFVEDKRDFCPNCGARMKGADDE